jgi:predicted NAD-dependent protein-ADP-ribosyltransferase YbiA (DUF1768 family)
MSAKKIIENGVINFFSRKEEFKSLSNFWMGDVVVDGVVYESGEHCFHGEKYRRIGEKCVDEVRKKKLLDYSKGFMKPSLYKNCNEVKKMGGKKGLLLSSDELSDWSVIGIEVQRKICRWKFDNYEEVRNDLKKSGGKILIHPALRCSEEKVKSRLWEGKGIVCDGKIEVIGGNMLGNLWMELRKENEL